MADYHHHAALVQQRGFLAMLCHPLQSSPQGKLGLFPLKAFRKSAQHAVINRVRPVLRTSESSKVKLGPILDDRPRLTNEAVSTWKEFGVHPLASFCVARAFALRTFADAAAAFLARALRWAFVICLAAALPPCAPVFLKNSSISVTEPNLSATPQGYELWG
jgi:hypothetical protein